VFVGRLSRDVQSSHLMKSYRSSILNTSPTVTFLSESTENP
jgi:hypothetical protein